MKPTLFEILDAACGCVVLFGLLALGLWVLWWAALSVTRSGPHCAALSRLTLTGPPIAAPMALTLPHWVQPALLTLRGTLALTLKP